LLFANPEQKPYHADKLLEREFQPFLAELNIPKAGFHAFRHASATILSQMKVPMEIRRQRMGHVDEEMTLRYTHVIEDAAKDVAAEFDKILLPEVASLEEKLSFQVSADLKCSSSSWSI
jgi:integrase